MNNKRVLVISHNPFSARQNNGKVLESFLSGWKKENIAQIYLHGNYIDNDFCNNYFKFSDFDVLKKIINKKYVIKKEEQETINNKAEKENRLIYNLPITWWFRSIVWQISKPWKYKEIIEWVKKFKPDIILYQASSFYTFYNFVLEIQKLTKAKLFMTVNDEYLSCINKYSILDHLKTKKMNKVFGKSSKKATGVFVVNEFMKEEYSKKFPNSNFIVLMNVLEEPKKVTKYIPNKNKVEFLYAGNILLNRWKNLAKLGKVLDNINKNENKNCILKICTLNDLNSKMKKEFDNVKCIKFLGKLNKEELLKENNNSDILVHTESFDEKNKRITRLSLSTKISEYMMSKRCVLAIGPKDISSIKYIEKYNVGLVITNKNEEEWYDKIFLLINDESLKEKYINNAIKISHNHGLESNVKRVQKILTK